MSGPIKAGDLVLCIRGPECCKSSEPIGGPYEVQAIRDIGLPGICRWCNMPTPPRGGAEAQISSERLGLGWIETHRLKKIPPLTDDEVKDEHKEILIDKYRQLWPEDFVLDEK
jgi:hypothetical protein